MLNKTLKYFSELSKIPRCSKNEKKAIEWCMKWATNRWYDFKTDKIWNLLISVPATVWKEDKETVVLQWHIDMVCVKDNMSCHDFSEDSIEVVSKDWWLTANKTTLGADNWIGVCMAMAACDITSHPPLELLITIDEEQWMSWALNLESWFITWTRLINLDSEDEWEITIWSAWWARIQISWSFHTEKIKTNAYNFIFTWIKWWHSGVEIHKSLWNAVDAFFQFLNFLDTDIGISFVKWWIAENVIPKSLEAIVVINNILDLDNKIKIFLDNYKKDYKEDNFTISYSLLDNDDIDILSIEDSNKLKDAILKSRSWVYKISDDIKDFVLTSQNLGVFELNKWNLSIQYLCRSSLEEDLEDLISKHLSNFSDIATVSVKDPYPGWTEDINSDLVKWIKSSYEKIIIDKVNLLWVHAWLECWAIISKMPKGSLAVSIWPNIFWAHTIEERCDIRSVWVLCDIIDDYFKNI